MTILVAALVSPACGHSQRAATDGPTEEVVLSFVDIDCQSCGEASVRALERREGVRRARFDRDRVELAVAYDPSRTSPDALLATVADLGFEATLGAGKGRYAPDVEFPPELDVQWISRDGEAVEILDHRVPGKVTVFDFYAEWCGPCREVDRAMLAILRERDDVALRKLDVADWETDVARRYLRDVPSLPYVIVYDKGGDEVEAISGLELDRLRRAIETGRAR